MKKLLISGLMGIAASLAMPSEAAAEGFIESAEGDWYVSGFVGVAFPDDFGPVINFDTDVFFGGAVGGKLPFKTFGFIHTRVEAEVSYFETDVADNLLNNIGSLDVIFVLANSYADFIWDEDQPVIPYIGGGLGIGIADDFFDDGSGTTVEFVTQSAVGLTVPVNNFDFYSEARYFRAYNEGPNFDGFTLTAGVRYRF